jgi:hypothetical protein
LGGKTGNSGRGVGIFGNERNFAEIRRNSGILEVSAAGKFEKLEV